MHKSKSDTSNSFISLPIPTAWQIVDEDGTTRSLQTYNPNHLDVLWVKIKEASLFTSEKRGSGLTVVALTWYKEPISRALMNTYENEIKHAALDNRATFTTTHRVPKEKFNLAENSCLFAGITQKRGSRSFDIYILVRDKDNTNWVLKYQLDWRSQDEWLCVLNELGLKLPKQ